MSAKAKIGLKSDNKTKIFEKDDPKIAGMYDLGKTIGKGHFAVVKLARHVFTNERVAVKEIDKLRLDELSRDHLFQEVVCMKLVKHPNVVRLYHIIDTATKLYLILELGDGGDLYDYISRYSNGICEDNARVYFRQIVNAIAYCHKLHIVHRDLKPENVVFFEKQGILKLTDFGFSNQFIPGNKLDTSCGSLAYSAPEILLGKPYDAPKVDIWSLGVILFMLVVGKPPFQEETDSETLSKIMDVSYSLPDRLSEDCKSLIKRLLVKDPNKRASLNEIQNDPWLSKDDQVYNEIFSEPLIAKNELAYEDHVEIMNRMYEGGLATVDEIQTHLDHDEYNHITATYYLLAERKLKRNCEELMRLNHYLQTNTENTPDVTNSMNEIHLVKPNPQDNRRFSMILEDEEYESDCESEGKKNKSFHHNIQSIIEEDLVNEQINEEVEEMETVFSLVQFRSDLVRSSLKTSSFYHNNDHSSLLQSQRNSRSMPPSSLSMQVAAQLQTSTRLNSVSSMLKDDQGELSLLRKMVTNKSCPEINMNDQKEERLRRINSSQSIDGSFLPSLRYSHYNHLNPKLLTRPGSMFTYSSITQPISERKRRSSVCCPIGIDNMTTQVSLRQLMSMRNSPNVSYQPHNVNVRRFLNKRRSVPHYLFNSTTQFPPGLNRINSHPSKVSTRSLSSSETPSDSEGVSNENTNTKFIKSFSDRRRGSSETVQSSKTSQQVLRKMKTHSASFQNQNFLMNHNRRFDSFSSTEANNNGGQEWYNSAPSLLNIDTIEKFKNIIQQPNAPLPTTKLTVTNQVTSAIREFCEPIREEEDETTKSISALNSPYDSSTNQADKGLEMKVPSDNVKMKPFDNRIHSSYYHYPSTVASQGHDHLTNQISWSWFTSFDDANKLSGQRKFSNDPDTRSLASTATYTRRYYFPKSSRHTAGALSPDLTPNFSLSSLASSLRQSRHMLDVVRGTFELQNTNRRYNSRKDIESYSPVSVTTLSNEILFEPKKPRKSQRSNESQSDRDDGAFRTNRIRVTRNQNISKFSNETSNSLLNESLEEAGLGNKNKTERKKRYFFSKSDSKITSGGSKKFIKTKQNYLFKVVDLNLPNGLYSSNKSLQIETRKNIIFDLHKSPKIASKEKPSDQPTASPERTKSKGIRFFCCHR